MCVLYVEEESVDHHFFSCEVVYIYFGVCVTNGMICVLCYLIQYLTTFTNVVECAEIKFIRRSDAFATILIIWLWRNEMIFKEESYGQNELLELVKLRSWKWIKATRRDFA